MTKSPKIPFKTFNYILYPNFSKITKSAQTFPKLQKVSKLFQNYKNGPNGFKLLKTHPKVLIVQNSTFLNY